MTKIGVLLYPGFTALDAVGPYEVLSRLPDARVVFLAHRAGPVVADTGALTMTAEAGLADLTEPDIVVVPGGLHGTYAAADDPLLLDWLRNAHATSTWTTSVCTGALLLGAAGLLDGLDATTHWAAHDALAAYGATYVPRRVVRSGRVITAAGVSAGIDMALELAILVAGPEVAESIQLALEYDPRPPFTTGSPATASPEAITHATTLLRSETLP
ncbi:glutamine amidotransferase [Catellatospora sp. TT07R-123]|uniref:DJ-1/PfpI family protein n=1 Tax=Catellatospora sp. TT07R-123 TaxID=2733863 RepID=UPI001B21EC6A|nr:DJ-1/PfpI family protein [Catellatospora sp. TT07R-123]GHJ49186.1 glutamine amidotransferase [Catellatospora sp. TT07R-123]